MTAIGVVRLALSRRFVSQLLISVSTARQ